LQWSFAFAALAVAGFAYAAEDRFPRVGEAYFVKRDGRVLWAGAADRQLPLASLAKMMTALIALERGELESMAKVSRSAAEATGTRIGLQPGESLRVRDLLAATVVRSANDACRALAEHLGKSVPAFVAQMNARAAALGLAGTHFEDPCGHDRPGQFSTAADLARLAEQVMQHPEYMRLAQVREMRISAQGGRTFTLRNTNALLGRYAGAIGLKTGYTERAGNCLVALAEKNGVRVLVVLLNAPNRWWNAVGLLDRAFEEPVR
jgi:serine-type D-Ala-D-Ala carboxypeptidase (penicillin-binding protein 5/6)